MASKQNGSEIDGNEPGLPRSGVEGDASLKLLLLTAVLPLALHLRTFSKTCSLFLGGHGVCMLLGSPAEVEGSNCFRSSVIWVSYQQLPCGKKIRHR